MLYQSNPTQIGFADASAHDTWLRADVYDHGVGFDRSGLCKLGPAECRQLAVWLLRAADLIVVPPPPAKPKVGRRRKAESQEGV